MVFRSHVGATAGTIGDLVLDWRWSRCACRAAGGATSTMAGILSSGSSSLIRSGNRACWSPLASFIYECGWPSTRQLTLVPFSCGRRASGGACIVVILMHQHASLVGTGEVKLFLSFFGSCPPAGHLEPATRGGGGIAQRGCDHGCM